METKNILLYSQHAENDCFYQTSIREYNELKKGTYYKLMKRDWEEILALFALEKQPLLFIEATTWKDSQISQILHLLEKQPDLRILLICEPKDIDWTNTIIQEETAYPFAVLGRILKPFQPGALWGFLDDCEKARSIFIFDSDSEEDWGDWNDFE